MKKLLIKIVIFALISLIIIIMKYKVFVKKYKRFEIENPNNFIYIITPNREVDFIEFYIAKDLIYNNKYNNESSALIKWKAVDPINCKIIYTIKEENATERIYDFDINDTPTSYYIIIKDKEFIFEKISSLNN